jgi:hypothetical protein
LASWQPGPAVEDLDFQELRCDKSPKNEKPAPRKSKEVTEPLLQWLARLKTRLF